MLVDAVAKKLQELNPGFDGKLVPKIERDGVVELQITDGHAADLSPIRVLRELKVLEYLGGPATSAAKLSDLSPLTGMQLTRINVGGTELSDLSPLTGMPLTIVNCFLVECRRFVAAGGV